MRLRGRPGTLLATLSNSIRTGRQPDRTRRIRRGPARPWTVAELAREAALSRSGFFERFNREVGMTPMEYLLSWRMALAKNMLRGKEGSVAEIAERVGYSSASTFSVAFTRFVGMPTTHYARA